MCVLRVRARSAAWLLPVPPFSLLVVVLVLLPCLLRDALLLLLLLLAPLTLGRGENLPVGSEVASAT